MSQDAVSQASPPPVEVRGLVKRYGELTAVAGVDVTVNTGDVYGYLGPNGAGKTTSLRMMLGSDPPDRGDRAAVRARPDGERPSAARRGRVRRGADLLSVPDRAAQSRAAGGVRRRRRFRPDPAGARDRRADRPRQGPRRRLLARDAPAARDRRRAAARPEADAARRARDRPRPGRDARHAPPDPAAGGRGHDGAALEPPAGGGRGAVQPGRDRPLGTDRLRGRDRGAQARRRDRVPARDDRRRARAADRQRAARRDRCARRRARPDHVHRRRAGGRRAVAGAGRGRRADQGPDAADGDARGPVLLTHRGRRPSACQTRQPEPAEAAS